MYRRLSLRLLCLLLTLALPASAQFTRDNAANKKIDEAINEHYLATDFDTAEGVLTGTVTACGDKCSPQVIARAWMYVGIVRGSGKNDQAGAKEAFQKAIGIDPQVNPGEVIAGAHAQVTCVRVNGRGEPIEGGQFVVGIDPLAQGFVEGTEVFSHTAGTHMVTCSDGASGLIDRVRSSSYTMASAEKRTLESLTLLVEPGSSPMCGNSICQDRRFLARHMPTLEKFFHYRNLDVSTLKELARRWAPSIIPGFSKQGTHQALADIQESIRELAYYRENFLAPEYQKL